MVLLHEMPDVARESLEKTSLPQFESCAWTPASAVKERRVAVVSSAGLSARGDKPFTFAARDHRVLEKDDKDLVMTHLAIDYDRIAWQQDLNSILPVDRLAEMAEAGEIGSVAAKHYSFMGASDPLGMKKSVTQVAESMHSEGVNTVLLAPV